MPMLISLFGWKALWTEVISPLAQRSGSAAVGLCMVIYAKSVAW
jgi:hypothetical protein